MPRKKTVTLQHLADELGLTIQTVSKALRGHSGMSEETRQSVVQAAMRLGYRTREQNRQLDRSVTYPIYQRRFLLVLSEPSVSFNRLLLQGLHERFAEYGHRIDTVLLHPWLSAAEFEEWMEQNGVSQCDGLFIAPRPAGDELEERLLSLELPRILLDDPPAGAKVDSVVWDVCEAMFLCVRELVDSGHRDIVYCGDISSQRGFMLRWKAFQEAMQESGLTVDPEQHVICGRDRRQEWLNRLEYIVVSRKPAAVICGIDEEVVPVFYRLQSHLRIPEDCSLIGFLNEQMDCLPLLDRPSLLIRDTGYRAADRMLWRIANPGHPYEHIRIRGEYVPGNTVIRREKADLREKVRKTFHFLE